MARAREARYAALEAALLEWTERDGSEGGLGRYIAIGHHADDRAETVLIRLLRGTGPAGLAVLAPRASHLVRPLVRARRTDIVAHVERHLIPHAHDPSNVDPRFLRTRVRRQLLPLLVELSPRIVEHLCGLADAASKPRSLEEGAVPDVVGGHRLSRAHRTELARALKNRNGKARVPLPGGKTAAVDLSTRKIVLIKAR
jgi:tRNA(Ile)-lysidine synthase